MSRSLSFLFLPVIVLTSWCNAQSVTSFTFRPVENNTYLSQEVICEIYGDSLIVGIVPYQTQTAQLVPYFETTGGATAMIGTEPLIAGITAHNFSAPVELFLSLPNDSAAKKYQVIIKSTSLPAVYISTQNEVPVESKDIYVNGAIKVYPNAQFENAGVYQENLQIKGRGNSTWEMPKKPYKIKLNKKAPLFGMASDKEWVLLANYSDKTLIRNSLAFETGKRFGLPYNPGYQPVDLFLNGRYQGSYLLTEQIKISSGRVNIEDLTNDDLSGGYLLEVDERLDEEFWFRTSRNVPFTIKEPSVNTQQFEYIKQYVQQAEDVLYGNDFNDPQNGYAAYLNTETFVNWYLVNELFKNNDAIFFSSVYLYKDKNSKLAIGPLWDFDIAAGNVNYNGNDTPQGWWIRNSSWISRLFDDPVFRKKVNDRWTALRSSQVSTLTLLIDQMAAQLAASQTENFHKWDILDSMVWPNPLATGSYQGEVDYLKTWLTQRIAWLDQQFSIPVLNTFGLAAPLNEHQTVISPAHPNLLDFSWQRSAGLVKYRWVLTKESGDFAIPVATSVSHNMGNDTSYSISSSDLIATLQSHNIFPGDSVRLKWTVYAYVENDSLVAEQAYILNVKITRELQPFILHTPANNAIAEPDQLTSLPFGWFSSKVASHYQVHFYTSSNQHIMHSLTGNNGHDTTFQLSKNEMQNILFTYGTVKGDSLVAPIRWTVYAYMLNTDSLKAMTTNEVIFLRKDSAVKDHRSVELATPADQSTWNASEDPARTNLFSWSSTGLKTGDYFKLYCTTENATFEQPLFVRTLTDTFTAVSDLFIHTILKEAGIKKGGSAQLKWNVYQYNAITHDSVKASQDFALQVIRERILKPFSILTPHHGDRAESFVNDSFADITFTWENNTPATYTLTGLVGETVFENITGNEPSFILKDEDIKEIFNAASATDSVTMEWKVTATEQDDSLACEPVSLKLVRHKLLSGLNGHQLPVNAVTLYPNPVSGNTLKFTVNDPGQKQLMAEITDLTGKVLQSFFVSGSEFTRDISALNNGIYFCRISSQNGTRTLKFVVSK